MSVLEGKDVGREHLWIKMEEDGALEGFGEWNTRRKV